MYSEKLSELSRNPTNNSPGLERNQTKDFCKIVLLYLIMKFVQGFINNKDHFTYETSQTNVYVTVRDVDFFKTMKPIA